ncbi:MAG: B12-binding domain-containing radical SAM protein [Candidatus Thorarchaeota archaeon]|jgi:radical SAM superfamily enzyme YgiQ (UPF0313 family)
MRVCLIAYDNDSFVHWLPLGIAYIASVLRNAGHEITIYNQDVYHYPESHLTKFLTENDFDVVGLGVTGGYYQYRKLLKISEAIDKVPERPFFIIGGHGPSPEPEYFLRKTKADVVVIGEGEISTPILLEAFEKRTDMREVKGIAFFDKSGNFVMTERQPLVQDLDSIPFPAYDLFPIHHYALMREPNIQNNERCLPILSSRGCPYTCNFCYRMDPGIRLRSPENIVREMQFLIEEYGVRYFAFIDELFMVSVKRTRELCNAFIEAELNVRWSCNGRLNIVSPELLEVMKQAGCAFVNYGIESVDDNALKAMNKKLTVEQITEGIEATLAAGLSPGFNIIWGNIGEDASTLEKGVQFLLKYDDHAQLRTIRPVTPYPGSELYYYAIDQGLLKDVEDFYENKHTNSDLVAVNFTNLSDEEFHKCLFDANTKLLENYHAHQRERIIETMRKLYIEEDASFRGFRQT